jgi:hypothetical protein
MEHLLTNNSASMKTVVVVPKPLVDAGYKAAQEYAG